VRLLAFLPGFGALLLAFAGSAHAQTIQLLPGVTYTRDVEFTLHGPVALRIVHGPRPVGLYRLSPELSNGAVTGRETVSSMERHLSSQATSIGVNGDYFTLADGRPSGIFMRDGVLVTTPNAKRSSAGITSDGTLDVQRVKFSGTWQGNGKRRMLNGLNKTPGKNEAALFTSAWGAATPKLDRAVVAVLTGLPETSTNVDLSATVASIGPGQARLTPGTAALVARGTAAARLQAEAPVGTVLTLRLLLQPDWAGIADAIGGGPVLVRDGKPVYRSNEAFSTLQLQPRAPRTAFGQLADGSIVLVTTDGRQPGYSIGMTNFELAQTLVRLGVVRGMAMDSGGSTTMAFDGTVLNRPSDGRERPISTALLLLYTGVYVPPVAPVVSPNGDGVDDQETLGFKIVRPSNVATTLTAPDGSTAFQETAEQEPGVYQVPFPPPAPVAPANPPQSPVPAAGPPAEGTWTLSVTATDDQGLTSSATRTFAVNSTIGFLQVSPRSLRLPPGGRRFTIRWSQVRTARVAVTVETADGVVLRTLARRTYGRGTMQVVWDGRRRGGRLAFGGRYTIRVAAQNGLGQVALQQPVSVRRTGSK
jgi:hypothetical protein